MAADRKPAPPSFYSNVAAMPPAPSPAASSPTGGGEGGDPTQIVDTLFKVFEKWSASDPKAKPFIDRMNAILKEYQTSMADGKSGGGAGPADASGGVPPGAGMDKSSGGAQPAA